MPHDIKLSSIPILAWKIDVKLYMTMTMTIKNEDKNDDDDNIYTYYTRHFAMKWLWCYTTNDKMWYS